MNRRFKDRHAAFKVLVGHSGAERQGAPSAALQRKAHGASIFKLRGLLMGLVHKMGVLHLKATKHPNQDVQEVGKLGEQRAAILGQRPSPTSRLVIPLIPVPRHLTCT